MSLEFALQLFYRFKDSTFLLKVFLYIFYFMNISTIISHFRKQTQKQKQEERNKYF